MSTLPIPTNLQEKKRSEKRQRTNSVNVRVKPEEHEILKHKAFDAGVSVAKYLRDRGLGNSLKSVSAAKTIQQLGSAVRELRKIRISLEAKEVSHPTELNDILNQLKISEQQLVTRVGELLDDYKGS